jgi:hypothetical protein
MRATQPLLPTLTQDLGQLRRRLAQLDTPRLARQAGFLQRSPRKIPIPDLLLALVALASEAFLSLERIATVIGLAAGTTYSKQALHKRLRPQIEGFLAQVAVALFGPLVSPLRAQGYLAPFRRLLVQDSTVQGLPEHLAQAFPGGRNQCPQQRAALKIQWTCDLLHGSLVQLSLSGFTRNDQAAAQDILTVAQPGDLVLRDLGYFSLSVLAQLAGRGVYFLSRFRHGLLLREPGSEKPLDLVRRLRQAGRWDGEVLVGNQKLPLRLVALPVPEEVANQRRQRAKTCRDRRWAPSSQRLDLLGWNIFLTNVGRNLWPAKVLAQVYRLRWRVEMIFKAWKSHLGLRQLNCRTAELLRLSIMTKLLFCILTCRCCDRLETLCPGSRQISLLRLARILGQGSCWVSAAILHLSPQALLEHFLARHVFYERRQDRQNFYQRLALLTAALG